MSEEELIEVRDRWLSMVQHLNDKNYVDARRHQRWLAEKTPLLLKKIRVLQEIKCP